MKLSIAGPLFCLLLAAAPVLCAQEAVIANSNHEQMLSSQDTRLAANKRLVYDFWREVFEARHMNLAEKYMSARYIQHNPLVPSGRAAFIDFFSKRGPPQPIEARVKAPIVSLIAEGDLVVISFVREYPEPKDAAQKYTTTWFDMFRIVDGKIDEHWDGAVKR